MGSIEVFPRKRGAGTLADVWRIAPLAAGGAVKVRAARLEDYAAIRALEREVRPGLAPLTLKQFESQRHAFPEGQLAAECEGTIVGAASSFVVQWDDYALDLTWKGITAEGCFSTHDGAGRTLYGSPSLADVTRHGFGIGRALHQARRRLCRKLNLRRIIVACPLPGYHRVHGEMTPELYARRVIWGDIDDPALRQQMSLGFHFCGIIHDYLPEDTASLGHAALTVWLNPLYSPAEPPAREVSQRSRRVA